MAAIDTSLHRELHASRHKVTQTYGDGAWDVEDVLTVVVPRINLVKTALTDLLCQVLETTPEALDPKDVLRFHRPSYEALFMEGSSTDGRA